MAIEQAMALTNRLLSHAQAWAAVTAYVRLAADGDRGSLSSGEFMDAGPDGLIGRFAAVCGVR